MFLLNSNTKSYTEVQLHLIWDCVASEDHVQGHTMYVHDYACMCPYCIACVAHWMSCGRACRSFALPSVFLVLLCVYICWAYLHRKICGTLGSGFHIAFGVLVTISLGQEIHQGNIKFGGFKREYKRNPRPVSRPRLVGFAYVRYCVHVRSQWQRSRQLKFSHLCLCPQEEVVFWTSIYDWVRWLIAGMLPLKRKGVVYHPGH